TVGNFIIGVTIPGVIILGLSIVVLGIIVVTREIVIETNVSVGKFFGHYSGEVIALGSSSAYSWSCDCWKLFNIQSTQYNKALD
ncbi:8382_t:CDS:2, partial [Gigaspora margarita]